MENKFKNVKVYPAGTNFYKTVYYRYFNNESNNINDNIENNSEQQSIIYSFQPINNTFAKRLVFMYFSWD